MLIYSRLYTLDFKLSAFCVTAFRPLSVTRITNPTTLPKIIQFKIRQESSQKAYNSGMNEVFSCFKLMIVVKTSMY